MSTTSTLTTSSKLRSERDDVGWPESLGYCRANNTRILMSAYHKPDAHPNNLAQNCVLVEKHRVAIFSFLFLLLVDKFQFFYIYQAFSRQTFSAGVLEKRFNTRNGIGLVRLGSHIAPNRSPP